MVSDETIRRAAEVLTAHPSIPNYRKDMTDRDYVCPTCGDTALVYGPNSPDHALHQAEQLAKAGLLAPAPNRAPWWRVIGPDGGVWCETSSESEARAKSRPGDTLQQLWETPPVSQWRTEREES